MSKTFSVADLLERINCNLRNPNIELAEKKALCTVIETVLFRTSNYKGYGYNFSWPNTPEAEREARQWDRHYYVNDKILPDYTKFCEIRKKDRDGCRI